MKLRFANDSLFVRGLLACGTIFTLFNGCTDKTQSKKEVNLAIWGNYLPPETQKEFSDKTGIKINITNYSSNEELLAKVQSGASGLDVAVPSDYMVDIMIKQNLLKPLEINKIESLKELSAEFMNQSFDPGNKFSLPYAWATTGIAYNTELLPKGVTNWKALFADAAMAGKISLLDDVREVMAVALKYNGNSVNSTNDAEINKAKEFLKSIKPKIKMFRSDTIEALLSKEIVAAHSYSTDANQAVVKSGGKIAYIIPTEGGTRSIDNLVILKGAMNQEAALALINFLLSPSVNVEFVSRIQAGPVLRGTKAKLPMALQNNKGLFPSQETWGKLERITDLGEKTELYDKAWTEVKTR